MTTKPVKLKVFLAALFPGADPGIWEGGAGARDIVNVGLLGVLKKKEKCTLKCNLH